MTGRESMTDATGAGPTCGTPPVLVAAGLRKEFGEMVALAELSLSVGAGEAVGLLGPNGAGKTTALQLLAGILTPTAGRIRVCGHDPGQDPVATRRHIGFISADTGLYRRLTPRETLRYFGRLHAVPAVVIEARIAELEARLALTAFVDRPCGQLSSGERQRANLARVLVHAPELLILDEPTTALDIVAKAFTLDVIRQARADGKAVLLSTHALDEVQAVCDRIVVLRHGRVWLEGRVAEFCGQLADLLLRRLQAEAGPASVES